MNNYYIPGSFAAAAAAAGIPTQSHFQARVLLKLPQLLLLLLTRSPSNPGGGHHDTSASGQRKICGRKGRTKIGLGLFSHFEDRFL